MNDQKSSWLSRVGPGLITACVVIGPGSILSSSKVGAQHGYSLNWVTVLAVVFMMVYMTLGARLGVISSESPGTLIARRAGRWLAALIGIGVFFISASFQFGNNLGVHSAFAEFSSSLPEWEFNYPNEEDPSFTFGTLELIVIAFNALAITFVFAFGNLYRAIERLMMVFVAIMLLAFAVNLFFAKPNLGDFAKGFVPFASTEVEDGDEEVDDATKPNPFADLTLLALVGTTFVITAAYNQVYLVQQKGWGTSELKSGLLDARIGSVIMALITIMLMSTAAAQLRGNEIANVRDVAEGLRPAFGDEGHLLFCLGLFSAAYSSFLVNSMIGGFIVSDGFGLGSKPTDKWPRIFTTAVLVVGMVVALAVRAIGFDPVPAIVAAQAVTVLASPLVAGALLWLTNLNSVMGDQRNRAGTNVLAALGFLLLLGMAWYTAAVKIPAGLEKMRKAEQTQVESAPPRLADRGHGEVSR